MDRPKIIDRVFAFYGGPSALAAHLGLTRQAVWQWQVIPLRHLKRIATETKIPRQKLRPDLYA